MALLGYLAAVRRAVARKTLVTLFWPDESADTGQANLRRELHNLGQILPGCWQIDSTVVQFIPDADTQVDIDTLSRLSRDEQWSAAAGWVGGEFLEGVSLADNPDFEAWLLGEQENRRQTAEQVLLQAALGEMRRGNDAEARRFLHRLLQFTPWHEKGHRLMMGLLARGGQFTAALKQYQQCRAILAAELDVTPSAVTTALYERIKTALAMPPPNLPPSVTPFIGRETEIAALQRLLTDPDCRLLTLTGVGGIGKSRLALQSARAAADDDSRLFLHGVAYASLAGVDAQDLIRAVGDGLGLAFSGPEPVERQLLHYLRELEILLLLDNYEHLLPDTTLLATVLERTSSVKLLVTSRERLKLREEWVFEVGGLPYPEQAIDDPEASDDLDYDAVSLFAACARRGQRSFSLAQSGREAAAISRLVQGMPLALELSAARLQALSPAVLLAELGRDGDSSRDNLDGGRDSSLDVLTADAGNAPPRHAGLRVVFDVSWAGLTAAEQSVLGRLSLFRGGFPYAAAEAVAGATRPILTALTDKSLIRLLPSGRYEIHELLRQYAAARLADDPARDEAARERYAIYYGAFLRQREERLLETDQEATLDEMTPEMDNVRLAWRWLIHHERLDILDEALWTLAFYYQFRGQIVEGMALVDETLTGIAPPDDREPRRARLHVRLYVFRAKFLMLQGRVAESRDLMKQILPQLRRWGMPKDVILGLWVLGHTMGWLGDSDWSTPFREGLALARASGPRWLKSFMASRVVDFLTFYSSDPLSVAAESRELLSEATAIAENLNNPYLLINTHLVDGNMGKIHGDYQRAEQAYEQALGQTKRINHLWLMAMTYRDLGTVNHLQGELGRAGQYYEEMRHLARRMGARSMEANLLGIIGQLARAEGELDRALEHFQAGLTLVQELGVSYEASWLLCFIGHTLLAKNRVGMAAPYLHKSLPDMDDDTDPELAGMVLAGVAGVLAGRGQPKDAARLAGAAQDRLNVLSRRLTPADLADWERIQAEVRGQLDEEVFASAWAEGQAMTIAEAARLSLSLMGDD